MSYQLFCDNCEDYQEHEICVPDYDSVAFKCGKCGSFSTYRRE